MNIEHKHQSMNIAAKTVDGQSRLTLLNDEERGRAQYRMQYRMQ